MACPPGPYAPFMRQRTFFNSTPSLPSSEVMIPTTRQPSRAEAQDHPVRIWFFRQLRFLSSLKGGIAGFWPPRIHLHRTAPVTCLSPRPQEMVVNVVANEQNFNSLPPSFNVRIRQQACSGSAHPIMNSFDSAS